MDLTVTQTLHNFTNIHYIIPHLGGAFPSIIDRLLRSQPALLGPSMAAYTQRYVMQTVNAYYPTTDIWAQFLVG